MPAACPRLVRPGIALVVAALLTSAVAAPATAGAVSAPACSPSQVLLFGSYPAEVSANLAREVLDPGQPTTIDGHDFYAGSLDGQRVVIGIAGPSPALATTVTTLALSHFTCVSAVVFTGTAGGAGAAELGDVSVPSRWTADEGTTYLPVDADALAVATSTAATAGAQLGTMAAVNDGTCLCSSTAGQLTVVPILRTPSVLVGGNGATFGGDADSCSDQGGMLAGCNPCPPAASPADGSGVALAVRRLTPGAAAQAARTGTLLAGSATLLERHSTVPAPAASHPANSVGNSDTDYVVTDQQTTGSMVAARAHGVPFIAFRGVSDTASVGDLWPSEYVVYQGLAADNAALAARLWIGAWNRRSHAGEATGPVRTPPLAAGPVVARPVRTAAAPVAPGSPADPQRRLAATGLPAILPWLAVALCGLALASRRARARR